MIIKIIRGRLAAKIEHAKQLVEQTGDIYEAVVRCGFDTYEQAFQKCLWHTAFEYLSHVNDRAN